MEITRVKAPKFRVGRYILNEYEFRTLQVEVAKGIKPTGIKVKDYEGNVALILESGSLSRSLKGLSLSGEITYQLLLTNRNKGE
jgi:hypothetical protein